MSEQLDQTFTTVKVSHPITEQRVRDLLCSAWEGGSSYWCACVDREVPPAALETIKAIKAERLATIGDGSFYSHEYPFIDGVTLKLKVAEMEEEGVKSLDRAALITGLQVMADKYPRQFHDFLIENDDAETGDIYLQCCLFGEAIFG